MGDNGTGIFESDEQREEYLNSLNNTEFSKRYHKEQSREREDGAYQRDFSRIMYASSFRRLQGKMQLLGIKSDQFFRNRLTHSLEVAQIARSIAFSAGYGSKEMYVVEAGALAHDIGNPPFGHSGERHLHEQFRKTVGGFEGNAQTLRILTSVEKKNAEFAGLNLTYRTLLSVVKYFNKLDANGVVHKKFIYDKDYEFLKAFIEENNIKVRTMDVQIVDIADEIAYAAHDLEDGLRQKCFTIDEVLHDFGRKYGNTDDSYEKLNRIVKESREHSKYSKNPVDSSTYSKLFRQELSSKIINVLIHDLGMCKLSDAEKIKRGSIYEKELGFKHYGNIAHGLKEITFSCINHNDSVFTYEAKGNIILDTLVEFYRNRKDFLPPEYRAKDFDCKEKDLLQERLICDYVSGMMDSYAINCYEKITGIPFEKIQI